MSFRSELGRNAESVAVDYLRAKGFVILGRNMRIGPLELDVVAQRDDLLVIVEVRTRGRGAFERPLESISPTKRKRVRKALDILWDRKLKFDLSIQRVRIDVAAVLFDENCPRVEYIENAF